MINIRHAVFWLYIVVGTLAVNADQFKPLHDEVCTHGVEKLNNISIVNAEYLFARIHVFSRILGMFFFF